MSDIAIKFENISKQYHLGTIGTGTLSHDLNRWWQIHIRGREDPYLKIGETNDRSSRGNSKYVWALRDINLEVTQGEVLGIIGKNGAGKSTLLKILSRVTSPTTGVIKARGRIASLLEVGTGFHPEMTGRENIFMNGAVMGMTKAEIRRKFDEIVDFAGVERYIDTPVKRYSSGMIVRLGFAIAAHLDPEILVVDEVLAVGDAEFQKKAVGKMQDVSRERGRTVLFVSHNLQALSALTSKSILIQDGLKIDEGRTDLMISYYMSQNKTNVKYLSDNKNEFQPHLRRVEVFTSRNSNVHEHRKMLKIEFEIFTPFPISSAALSYQIINSNGQAVLHMLNLSDEISFCRQKGIYKLISILPDCRLYPDTYCLNVHFADKVTKTKFEMIKEICTFEVKVFKQLRDYYWYPKHAVYIEDNEWIIEKIE